MLGMSSSPGSRASWRRCPRATRACSAAPAQRRRDSGTTRIKMLPRTSKYPSRNRSRRCTTATSILAPLSSMPWMRRQQSRRDSALPQRFHLALLRNLWDLRTRRPRSKRSSLLPPSCRSFQRFCNSRMTSAPSCNKRCICVTVSRRRRRRRATRCNAWPARAIWSRRMRRAGSPGRMQPGMLLAHQTRQ
ncbi:hypothetical protein MPH_00732 [Macrophomina phaseolina MS6]|uniref:Uncharacterized protein n=1 Tax=Macrophomina phaseolina (strain MS6) TaxID=1126212 RepID=K2S4C6_MACPH|nr:hypothetical protein MPH_00732 [Macrophomina phaseolina MS6]